MSEAAQTVPGAPPKVISASQGAQMFAERRAKAETPQTDPVREAARTLGQHGAKARHERQAEASAAQEPQDTEGEQPVADTPETEGTPGDLNATDPQSTQPEPTKEAESAPQTVDLGDGVTVTLEEVKEGFLRQADYTRKTQDLAEQRKGVETVRSQKLAQLDQVIHALGQKVIQPKSLKQFLAEDPTTALERFAEQGEHLQTLEAAREIHRREQTEQISQALTQRDQTLAETYNPEWADPAKRDAAYTNLTGYALKLGAKPEQLRLLTDPWMVIAIHKAMERDAIDADKAKVTKAVVNKPPVVKPGAKVTAGAVKQSEFQRAQAQLKSTGSVADAISLLRAKRATRG